MVGFPTLTMVGLLLSLEPQRKHFSETAFEATPAMSSVRIKHKGRFSEKK
jgi:hypothetical protein